MTDLVGIAIWNFGQGTLAQRIERAVSIGYNAASLIMRDARALAQGELPEVEDVLLQHRLPITIHGGLAAKGEPIDHEVLASHFQSFTTWHSRTGLLRSVNFDAAKRLNELGDWVIDCDDMHDVLAELLGISHGAGFTVGIEDWPRCEEDLRYVEDLRAYEHYGMLIDLGHLNMRIAKADDPEHPFSLEAARDYLDKMILPVNELHIHNNDGKRDLHAPPDVGTSDVRALAGLLRSSGKLNARGTNCVSTTEIVPAWCGLTEEEGWQATARALNFWRDLAAENS